MTNLHFTIALMAKYYSVIRVILCLCFSHGAQYQGDIFISVVYVNQRLGAALVEICFFYELHGNKSLSAVVDSLEAKCI